MAKALKRMLATQLQDDLEGTGGILVLDPGSMTVESSEGFRTDLREKAGGARLRILHNRTARVAFRNLWFEDGNETLESMLQGPTAIAFGGDGPVPIAKVVRDWRKKWKKLQVKGAVTDGEVLEEDDATALAELPDLPQLKGMLLGAVLGAPRGIAVSMSAVYGGLARCLQARIDEQGGAEGDAEESAA